MGTQSNNDIVAMESISYIHPTIINLLVFCLFYSNFASWV